MLFPSQNKVACPQLPGNYSVHCNKRQLRVFWIPPRDDAGHFVRAVPTFREAGSPRFTSFADQLRPPGELGRHYDHNGTKPNTVFEFGLNHVTDEGVISIPPLHKTATFPPCVCTSPPDVPDPATNFNCHYLHENDYTCEWTPGKDHGSPLDSYKLQYISYNASDADSPKLIQLAEVPGTSTKVNVTLPIRGPTEVQLSAVNGVGSSRTVSKTVKPPLYYHSAGHWTTGDYFIYGAIGLGILLLFSLLILLAIYKRRRVALKGNKQTPFLINFSRGRGNGGGGGQIRLFNGSLQDTSLAATKTTSLSGPPFELLSSCEPGWSKEINSLYGPAGGSSLDAMDQPLYTSMLIGASQLRFLRYIGCGAFGKVWEGRLIIPVESTGGEDRLERVALKVRNMKSLSESEFKREAALMQRYQHDNIVRFYGVSLDSPQYQCLVLEMMEQGNLREYLHRARPRLTPSQVEQFSRQELSDRSSRQTETTTGDNGVGVGGGESGSAVGVGGAGGGGGGVELEALLTLSDLVGIMRDVARGCHYLEEQHFVHRDIAARNCLVSHNHVSGRIVKLCDFGLARDIYKNDYYRKRNEPKLPVRWMSPEAILEGLFTSKSDIWAFSVTCWEVMSLGADPFFGQINLEVINLVLGGNVLSKPENCPSKLYDHMLQCWSRFPEIRPTFSDVVKIMDEFVEAAKDPDSPFSGPFIYRVSQHSQSVPTVDNSDWRYNGGVTRNGNISDINLIQSTSLSFGSTSGERTTSQEKTTSSGVYNPPTHLQRHISCPRPYVANNATGQMYYNRPSSYMMPTQYDASFSQQPLAQPTQLRRQHSDRYQYHRDPLEVDSMGYERPALVMTSSYFNTRQQYPTLYRQVSQPQPPNYAIPARPPCQRDSNYGIMHHSLYVGGGLGLHRAPQAHPREPISPAGDRVNILRRSSFEFRNRSTDSAADDIPRRSEDN